MNYLEISQLMTDAQFRGRIKVAVLTYAIKILGDAGNYSNVALRWANAAFRAPDQSAQTAQSTVVMEPGVLGQGAAIDDGTLQFSVEQAMQKIWATS